MKKMKRRSLAMGVCLAVLLCCLLPVHPVDAAAKTVDLTVCYKGKDVTFERFHNVGGPASKVRWTRGVKTYAAVKKAWGKATKVEKESYMGEKEGYCHTWKNGKTRIVFHTQKNGKRYGDIVIDIRDKKATLCGIRVGMSKKQALQKLRKQFGKKNVSAKKNKIYAFTGPSLPLIFDLRSGKVSGMNFMAS